MFAEMKRGARATLPVAASCAAYGSVLGALAAQKGINGFELMFMNTAVFAGSAQFVMADMWNPPLPILEMTLAVLIINLRYLLIGASLAPLFAGKSALRKLCLIHLTADENWAVTVAEERRGTATTGFLFGGGVCVYAAWSSGTMAGLVCGAAITNPEAYALDFAFAAVFISLAAGLWRGREDLLPWTAAVLGAWLGDVYLPGKWYILAGGLAGAATAACGPVSQAGKALVGEAEDADA